MMIDEKAQQLSSSLAAGVNDILRKAIIAHTGCETIDLVDLARRGRLAKFTDGTEVFSYDGVDLIRFWPVRFCPPSDRDCYRLRLVQDYQLLATGQGPVEAQRR